MPTNEAEVPPQKIWLWLYDPTGDNDWPRQVWANDKSSELHVPYVPASALAEVWQKVICITDEHLDDDGGFGYILRTKLVAARDAALSVAISEQKEKNSVR